MYNNRLKTFLSNLGLGKFLLVKTWAWSGRQCNPFDNQPASQPTNQPANRRTEALFRTMRTMEKLTNHYVKVLYFVHNFVSLLCKFSSNFAHNCVLEVSSGRVNTRVGLRSNPIGSIRVRSGQYFLHNFFSASGKTRNFSLRGSNIVKFFPAGL